MRKWRSGALFLAVSLIATLVQGVAPPVASAVGGPSVPLPTTPSVPVTNPGHADVDTNDETTPRALNGNQTSGGSYPSGSSNYAATSLSPSAMWQVSAQTGAFTWSYPLPVPPAPGGLAPSLALSYSSSAVDGLTSATNNQASWIGDGWSLWPGFIERNYRGCADDLDGTGEKPGDLCWHSDNAVLSLNGSGGQLVRDSDPTNTTEVWKAKDDDGSRIERVAAPGNGDDNGESWKITTVDGTQYFFGSIPTAKSTWTVPVYGDDLNEPCHRTTGFADSWCTQGYRWNLDKVVDRHGNMIRYYYETETNHYGRNKNSAVSEYVRGGWLDHVDYGLRADDANVQASGKVEFGTAERCVKDSDCVLSKPLNYPDVPLDLKCDGGSCVDKWGPSFWTTKRLATVTTRSLVGGEYKAVDSWALRHELPDPGDGEKPALWLKGITHTGHTGPTGSTSIALPEVTFDGVRKDNRVHGTDGYAALVRFRMNAIVSETGGVTSIAYAEPDCVFGSTMPTDDHTNDMRCFPVRWTPPMSPERTDYFHKYVVSQVSNHDGVAGTLADVTTYEYLDGAAWHWDTSEFVKEDKKNWNEFRGFSRVRIRRGSGADGQRTMTEQRYYRGMDGDKQPTGTRPATVTDSQGVARTDSDWLHGFQFEQATFERDERSDQPDPQRIVKTITDPFAFGPTATRDTFQAYIVRPQETRTYTAVGDTGVRITSTRNEYDHRWGLPTSTSDLGDTTTDADDLCTTTTYRPNEGSWLIDFPSRVETVSLRCGQTPQFPEDAVSDVLTSYDSQDPGLAPTTGNATEARVAASRPATGPVYVVTAKSTYDVRGRVLTATDALSNTTTTAFTPAVAGPVTQVVTTAPPLAAGAAGFTTTTTFEALRGLSVKVTDTNNRNTERAYDALGRSTEVWLPNRSRGTYPNSGSYKFAYTVRNDGPNAVTTTKLGPNDNYVTTTAIFDGLLRPRQAQVPAPGGGRLLTDTRYDSQGRSVRTTQRYYNSAAVDAELWFPPDNAVPGTTTVEYDGAGRPTKQAYLSYGTEKWYTTTEYGGDRITVTPPAGGTKTTTITDARGRTTELRQHGPNGDSTTIYEYTPANQLAKVIDPGGNIWTYTYDLRGRKTEETDPDRGQSGYTYDDADQLLSTTDDRGTKLFYEYDNLGRKTVLHRDSITGLRLADWTYDTVANSKGLPATSTRYINGNAYKTSVLLYTSLYQAAKVEVEIPSVEGTELAGKYASTLSYKVDGSLASETYAAAGAIPAEGVAHSYSDLGLPLRTWGGYGGETFEYVLSSGYTSYGELQRLELGQGTKRAWLSYYFQDDTRRLDRTVVDAEVANPMQADLHYTYDDIGNITSIADTTAGQTADLQCFRYDHLRRLTEAWTPETNCAADPTLSTLGEVAPYWQSYGYDLTGNRVQRIEHTSLGDTTSTYTYQGHKVDTVTTTTGGATTLDEYDYDLIGNTTSRVLAGEGQTLEWDAEGHLAKVTENGQETTYVYSADGQRLIRRDPQAVTLYLGSQEIRLDRTSRIETGTRYYTHGSQKIAVRTQAGLNWLGRDHHGTDEVSVNSVTQQTSRRRHLPFGEPRGTAPSIWPGERGFVGGTIDASTGLINLGAREYDPTLGRFISVDPIMDLTDPQQMSGYTYSNNNPITFADPSGLKFFEGDNSGAIDSGACKDGQCGNPAVCSCPTAEKELEDTVIKGNSPKTKDPNQLISIWQYMAGPNREDFWNMGIGDGENACFGRTGCRKAWLYILDHPDDIAGAKKIAATYCVDNFEECAGEFGFEQFVNDAMYDALMLAGLRAGGPGRKPGACSFAGDTEVLMADGTTKPIKDVQVGDQVQATDPETGETGARTVVAVWHHQDTVLKLRADDGATVTVTEDHPFWNATDHEWQPAQQLDPGDHLYTGSSRPLRVTGLDPASLHTATAYNLTVRDIHTYYVVVRQTPVLVHNGGPGCGADWISPDRLPHHYKHARDFGISGGYNKANGQKFVQAIQQLRNNPGSLKIRGTFRGQDAIHYVDDTGLHVSFAANGPSVGKYLGGWRSDGDQLVYLLRDGVL